MDKIYLLLGVFAWSFSEGGLERKLGDISGDTLEGVLGYGFGNVRTEDEVRSIALAIL